MQALGCTHCLSLNRTACKVRLVPGDVKLEEDFVSANTTEVFWLCRCLCDRVIRARAVFVMFTHGHASLFCLCVWLHRKGISG